MRVTVLDPLIAQARACDVLDRGDVAEEHGGLALTDGSRSRTSQRDAANQSSGVIAPAR